MQKTATIANGASLSGSVDFGQIGRLVAVLMPAGWDAAGITFQVSEDGTNFSNLRDDAHTEVTISSPAAGEAIGFRNDFKMLFSRWQFIKVRSGTSGAPVNQTAQRSVILLGDVPGR